MAKFIVINILILVPLSYCYNFLETVNVDEKNICKQNIVREIYDKEASIIFVQELGDADDLNVYVPDRAHIIFSTKHKYKGLFNKSYDFVIPARNSTVLFHLLRKLWNERMWDKVSFPRRRYLIFMEDDEDIEEVVRFLKERFIIRLIIIVVHNATDFTAYRNVDICKEPSYVIENCNCNNITIHLPFLNLKSKSLKGCSIKIVTLPLALSDKFVGYSPKNRNSGITIRPMIFLKHMFGARVSIIVPNRKDQIILGNPYNDLNRFDGDVLACSASNLHQTYKYFELSQSIFTEPNVWLMEKPKPLNNIQVILHIWNYRRLLLYLTCFIVTVMVDRLFQKFLPSFNTTLGKSIMYFLQLSFGSCVRHLPIHNSKRLFLTSYLIFSFYMTLGFQSQLSSVLTVPLEQKPMNSIQELFDNSYTMILPIATYDYVKNSKRALNRKLMEHAIFFDRHKSNLTNTELALLHPKSAVMTTKFITGEIDINKFYFLHDSLIPDIDLHYVLPTGSYYMHYVNVLIDTVRENGLVEKWVRDIMQNQISVHKDHFLISLNIRHFQGAFTCLIIGFIFSLFVFFVEMLFNKCDSSRKKQRKFTPFPYVN